MARLSIHGPGRSSTASATDAARPTTAAADTATARPFELSPIDDRPVQVAPPPERTGGLLALFFGRSPAGRAPAGPSRSLLFQDDSLIRLEVRAPFAALFERKGERLYAETDVFEGGQVIYVGTRGRVELDGKVGLRGNTSLGPLTFPKLRLSLEQTEGTLFDGASRIRVGTHGGDFPEDELVGMGMGTGILANELAPFREALAYELLELVGLPVPKVRRAEVRYVDTGTGEETVRYAFLLETAGDLAKRCEAERVDTYQGTFADTQQLLRQVSDRLRVRVELAEILLGNWDYRVGFRGEDNLWNIELLRTRKGELLLAPEDFNFARIVNGATSHTQRLPATLLPNEPEHFREMVSALGDLAARYPSSMLSEAIRELEGKQAALVAHVDAAMVDDAGRALAKQQVTGFFRAVRIDFRSLSRAP